MRSQSNMKSCISFERSNSLHGRRLSAVARKAFTQKDRGEGLRAIREEAMLDVMYDALSEADQEVVITEDSINGKHVPI